MEECSANVSCNKQSPWRPDCVCAAPLRILGQSVRSSASGRRLLGGGASVQLTRLLADVHAAAAALTTCTAPSELQKQKQTSLRKDRSANTRSKADQSSEPAAMETAHLFVAGKVALPEGSHTSRVVAVVGQQSCEGPADCPHEAVLDIPSPLKCLFFTGQPGLDPTEQLR